MSRQLIFVYNVDASPSALLRDLYTGLKTGTTDCHLCDLTFGKLLKDRTWKSFVDELPIEVDFQLRSTFTKKFPSAKGPFPAAFVLDEDDSLTSVLDSETINSATDLDSLRQLVGDVVNSLANQ